MNSTTRHPRVVSSLATRWGRRVAARRQELGLSQQQLAELCDVKQQTISKIESGTIIPLDRLKVTISAKLGTNPAELFPWPPMAELVEGAA